MAETESGWTDDERLWGALKYRVQAAHESLSRVRRQEHLAQALLYLNALNAAVVTDTIPRDLLTAEEAKMVIGAIPLQSGILPPTDLEQLTRLREAAEYSTDVLDLAEAAMTAAAPYCARDLEIAIQERVIKVRNAIIALREALAQRKGVSSK